MADAIDFSDLEIKEPHRPTPAGKIDFSDLEIKEPGPATEQMSVPDFDSTQASLSATEFGRGVARGSLQIASGMANFVRMFGDTKKGAIKDFADQMLADAQQIPTSAGSIKDVLAHPTLAPAYVSRVVGELAPQAVMAYLTGGVGNVAGKALGLGKAGMRVAVGAGAAATSIPQEVGNMYEESGSKAAALAFGIPSGMLDALSAERIIGKVFRAGEEEAKRKAWRQIVRDTVKEIPKTAGVEGTTESIQEMLAIAANKSADHTYEALTPENGWRMLEAAVAGAIGGGVLGGGTELAQLPARSWARGERAGQLRLVRQVRDAVSSVRRPSVAPELDQFIRTPARPATDESGTAQESTDESSPVDNLIRQNKPRQLLRAPDRYARTPVTDDAGTYQPGEGVTPVDELLVGNKGTLLNSAEDWDRAVRHGRSDEWFEGAMVNEEARSGFDAALSNGGQALQAHGMSKEHTLGGAIKNVLNLIQNGLDMNRRGGWLDTAPLVNKPGEGLVGATASGSAYRDGPLILVAKAGGNLNGKLEDLGAILVNQAHPQIVESLRKAVQAMRPDILVDSYANAGNISSELLGKSKPTPPVAAKPTLPASRLIPVLVTASGKTYPGTSHADAVMRATALLSTGGITPEELQAVFDAQSDDYQHQFLDVQTGQVYDRNKAAAAIGFDRPLDSQDLASADKEKNLQQLAPKPVTPAPVAQPASTVPVPDWTEEDYQSYIAAEKAGTLSPNGQAKLDAYRKNKPNAQPAPTPAVPIQSPGIVAPEEQTKSIPPDTGRVRTTPEAPSPESPAPVSGFQVYDRSTLSNKFNMSEQQLSNVKPRVKVTFDAGKSKAGTRDARQAEQRDVFVSYDSKTKQRENLLIQTESGDTIWQAPIKKLVDAGIITKFKDEFGAGWTINLDQLMNSNVLERRTTGRAANLEGYKLPDERVERSLDADAEVVVEEMGKLNPFLGAVAQALADSGELTSHSVSALAGMRKGGAEKAKRSNTKMAAQVSATFKAMIDKELDYARRNLAELSGDQKLQMIELAKYRSLLEKGKGFTEDDVQHFSAWLANSQEFQIAKTDTELVSLEEVSGSKFGDSEGGGGESPDSNPIGATWDPARTDSIIGTIEDKNPQLYRMFEADPQDDKAWEAIEQKLVEFLKGDRAGAEILAEAVRARRMEGWVANLGSIPQESFEDHNWITGISRTGKDGIQELLENRDIQLDPEVRRVGLALLKRIPAKYLNGLTMSITANGGVEGEFIPWLKTAVVAMHASNPETAAHEMAHYLAQFLTDKERAEVSKARQDELNLLKNDPKNAQFLEWLELNGGSQTSAEFNMSGYEKEYYHLINDDEYFAHYMSKSAAKPPAEIKGFISQARDIINQILTAIKAWLGNRDAYFDQLMQKFQDGDFNVDVQGGMLYERNNSNKPKSLPPISNLKELAKYRAVDSGDEETAFVNTLTTEQNQPIVGHLLDQLKGLPRSVRNELRGLIGRAAALKRTSTGPRVAQTPLKHYATIVAGLSVKQEAKALSDEVMGLVQKIQEQNLKGPKASQAEAQAAHLEQVAKDIFSSHKNFLLSEQKRSKDEGVAVGLGEAIKALDAMKESTTSLKRAVEYMSELISLDELNNPNLNTQQLVDLFKRKLRDAANVADWQQAVIPPGGSKPGVSNEQLRIAVNMMRQNQNLVQELLTYKELSDPQFAGIMKEDGDYTTKQIAGLTHSNLRTFLKSYYSTRSARDRSRKVYIQHRARLKNLIEQLENKLSAEEFMHSQVLESPQFKSAMEEAAQMGFMSADIVRDGNGNDVLKRTYYNPLDKTQSLTITDGTSREDYERNINLFEQVQEWYHDALESDKLDPLDKARINMELGRIQEVEYNPAYDPQLGKRAPGALNAPNILSNLTGNSLQFAMSKIGGRASVQATAVFQARSEARRRVQEVRHSSQHRFQLAILDAAKAKSLTISRWVKEVAEPILASYNSIGAKPYKAGDTTQYGHRITGHDLNAVRAMKQFADDMNKASGDMDIQTAKLHPVRIKEFLSGREITRPQQGHTDLVMPRRFDNSFIQLLRGWREAENGKPTKDSLPQLAAYLDGGQLFKEMLLAHIRSTQKYPDYANRTKFGEAYRQIYREHMNGEGPANFQQVVDKVFDEQSGDSQMTKDEIAKAILFELDNMANKVLDKEASDRAADSPGTSTSVQSANNFMTKSRGEMIAPDSGYKYSIVDKSDVQWMTRSVLEVHEQMALDGLVKVKKMLEDYLREWENVSNAQAETRKQQLSGEDWLNQREAKQMLNQVNRHIGLTSHESFNSFIDSQFGGIAGKAWSILIQSLLQSATVLKNNFLGMNLRLWQNEAQWRGDGLWMGMPKWLLKFPKMATNGIYYPMRDIPAFALSSYAYGKMSKKFGEEQLRKMIYDHNLFNTTASAVGGSMLKRAVNVQRAKDLGAAGGYGLKEQVKKYIRMFTLGGELNVTEPDAWQKIKGGIESVLGLIQETGGGLMLPKALAPRKLEQLLNFQAIRYADRLLEDLKLNILEAHKARLDSGRNDPITDAELLGDVREAKGNAQHMRNIFNRAGINLDAVAKNMWRSREMQAERQELLTPAQWNSFVLEVAKELNMPASDNRVQYRSGFARLMSSLMGYGMWYNERAAEAMAGNSRKKFDGAAVYRAAFFAAAIAAIGMGVSTPLQRWLKKLIYNEDDQTGHISGDNTATRNAGALMEQTAPFWPIIGSIISQFYDARSGGSKLFNFLPVTAAQQLLQAGNEIAQTGNVFYPTIKFAKLWLPNTKILLNRLPETEGMVSVNNASRTLRSVADGSIELRTPKGGGAIKYSPTSTETQMVVNEIAKPSPDMAMVEQYRKSAVDKLVGLGADRKDAERRFDLSVLARFPQNSVYGRTLTPQEYGQQVLRMNSQQSANLAGVESAFNNYAKAHGLHEPGIPRQVKVAKVKRSANLVRARRSGLTRSKGLVRRKKNTRLVRR